jgi:hypothetical protein
MLNKISIFNVTMFTSCTDFLTEFGNQVKIRFKGCNKLLIVNVKGYSKTDLRT